MLDKDYILSNSEEIAVNIRNRRSEPVDLDALRRHDVDRRALIARLDNVRTQIKQSQRTRNHDDDVRVEARRLRDEERELRLQVTATTEKVDDLLRKIPNLTHPDSPIGDEGEGAVVAIAGPPVTETPEGFRDHLDIGTSLGLVDFEAGTHVAGPGFYFLEGDGVLLEMALQQLALDKLIERGYMPQMVPELVRSEILEGTGYSPRAAGNNAYMLENEDLGLIATAEIALCGRYSGHTFDASALPLRISGISHAFRSERAHGRATRGLFRVHQFTKVEIVVICEPSQSANMLKELVGIEREIWDELEIPYRVIDIPSGDLGAPAYRKYDIEAWMPGRGEGGAYSEVTSASNCTDYQARRLNIRYRDSEGRRAYVHTLNATGIAVGRAMIAVLERYQRPDGLVDVPAALSRYLGGRSVLGDSGVVNGHWRVGTSA